MGAFQRLNVRLLVDRDDERALGRIEIEPDDLGGLGGKLGVGADAPRFAPGQVDLCARKNATHLARARRRAPWPSAVRSSAHNQKRAIEGDPVVPTVGKNDPDPANPPTRPPLR